MLRATAAAVTPIVAPAVLPVGRGVLTPPRGSRAFRPQGQRRVRAPRALRCAGGHRAPASAWLGHSEIPACLPPISFLNWSPPTPSPPPGIEPRQQLRRGMVHRAAEHSRPTGEPGTREQRPGWRGLHRRRQRGQYPVVSRRHGSRWRDQPAPAHRQRGTPPSRPKERSISRHHRGMSRRVVVIEVRLDQLACLSAGRGSSVAR